MFEAISPHPGVKLKEGYHVFLMGLLSHGSTVVPLVKPACSRKKTSEIKIVTLWISRLQPCLHLLPQQEQASIFSNKTRSKEAPAVSADNHFLHSVEEISKCLV